MINYGFSPGFVLRWLATTALGRRRDAGQDGEREFARYRPAPRAIDGDRIPREGPFIVVVNHYERPGLRMWWTAWHICVLAGRRRPGPGIRWMITNRFAGYRLFGVTVVPEASIRWFLSIVARTYELLPVDREAIGPRAPMLRHAYRILHSEGRPLGIAPEGANAPGQTTALGPAVPGSGEVIAWLSHGEIPILPVGVYDDEDGRLTARFGEPFTLLRRQGGGERDAGAPTERVMLAIAELLPVELRGVYAAGTGR